MIRLDAIPSASPTKNSGFSLFTSPMTGLAMLGIYINMASILLGKA